MSTAGESLRPKLQLLLADVGKHRPTLEDGLPDHLASGAPRPAKVPRGIDPYKLEAPGKDLNDLALQRWGIIIPDSPEGQARFEAIDALRVLRRDDQGAEVRVFKAPKDMDLKASLDWRNKYLLDERKMPEAERPKYLLILGDLNEVSAELGHVLADGSIVGRIHFDSLDGYQAYAQKVSRWEKAPTKYDRALAKFFVSGDGSPATMQGETYLVNECIKLSRRKTDKPFPAEVEDLWRAEDVADFLGNCAQERPSVLLSVSHGAARSAADPWSSPEEQRRLQGALVLDRFVRDTSLVTAETVKNTPFLPGGLWFMLACFGAGTPLKSAYHAWLTELAKSNEYEGAVASVLESLAVNGERPFLAAMPKAALANPNGPLAVIGHIDLAWTHAFMDPKNPTASRASRIWSSLKVMASGDRIGVAHHRLMDAYRSVNDELVSGYDLEADLKQSNPGYVFDPAKRANAFMLRNDLRGYILLGDPAARLPIAGNKHQPRPVPVDTSITGRNADTMEAAVLAVLVQGSRSSREIAMNAAISVDELERWVSIYKAAGKDALSKLK